MKKNDMVILAVFILYMLLSGVRIIEFQFILVALVIATVVYMMVHLCLNKSNEVIKVSAAGLILVISVLNLISLLMKTDTLSTVLNIVLKAIVLTYSIERCLNIDRSVEEKAQIDMFISQMNPHFTFNALNTIRYYVKTNAELAYDMLYDFAKYFRGNIDALTYEGTISILTEIAHLKSYTNIELERFKDKLSIEYELEEVGFMVPPLSIFPIVENAIKHGVRAKAQPGTVVIKSYTNDESYVVEIMDDGPGFDVDNIIEQTNGTGIKRVKKKLKMVKGARLEYVSEAGIGTKAYIYLPK